MEINSPISGSATERRSTWVVIEKVVSHGTKATYHFPGLPIPDNQFPMSASRHRGARGPDYQGDSRTTDLHVFHRQVLVVLKVECEHPLEGYFMRRAIQEVEEVNVDEPTRC